jgi:hypothetical protein
LLAWLAGGVTSFKATDKKVVNKNPQQQQDSAQDEGEKLPWHKMKNLGDMEGTLDGWVLFISFSLSFITAIVGVFQMIDKPYTAQVKFAAMPRSSTIGNRSSMLKTVRRTFGCAIDRSSRFLSRHVRTRTNAVARVAVWLFAGRVPLVLGSVYLLGIVQHDPSFALHLLPFQVGRHLRGLLLILLYYVIHPRHWRHHLHVACAG